MSRAALASEVALAEAILALCDGSGFDADACADVCLAAAAQILVANFADDALAEAFIIRFRHAVSAARVEQQNQLQASRN